MNELGAGYDARVYDSTGLCVYAAHTRYKNHWIGEPRNKPLFSEPVQQALQFAIETHEVLQKQKRKGKDIPFITHPLTVGLILAKAGASDDVIAAGILHDTIEDSAPEHKVTRAVIVARFGETIADLVDSTTEQNKALPWAERKRLALEHIDHCSSDALLVKSADILANTLELLADTDQVGAAVWTRFNAPKEAILTNAQNVLSALLRRWPDNPLSPDLRAALERISSKIPA